MAVFNCSRANGGTQDRTPVRAGVSLLWQRKTLHTLAAPLCSPGDQLPSRPHGDPPLSAPGQRLPPPCTLGSQPCSLRGICSHCQPTADGWGLQSRDFVHINNSLGPESVVIVGGRKGQREASRTTGSVSRPSPVGGSPSLQRVSSSVPHAAHARLLCRAELPRFPSTIVSPFLPTRTQYALREGARVHGVQG